MADWRDDFELASTYTDDTLAQQAASTATTAASEASAAKSDAASAKTTATSAASTASAADTKATQAATAAAQADTKAGNALDTATDAATAAATADSKATEAATTATTAASTATQAKTAATTAQTKAEAADTKATTAASDAATAKTTAAGAASTASTAKTTADNAASTANTAKTTANTAKTTADTAKSTADTAKTTATAAATTATEAKETAVEAKETADATANYFIADDTGAYVASVEGNHDSGKNLKLSTDGLSIRNGTTDMAAFTPSEIRMGTPTSSVSMMGGRMILGDNGMGSGFPAIFSKVTDTATRSEIMFVPDWTDKSKTRNIYTSASHTFNTFGHGSMFVISDDDITAGGLSLIPVTKSATWNNLLCTITKFGPFVLVAIKGAPSSTIAGWSTFDFGLASWAKANVAPANAYRAWVQAYPCKVKLSASSSEFLFMTDTNVTSSSGEMSCFFMYSIL